MDVCCECCVLSGRGLCDGLITRPEESCRLWCVVVCDLETSSIMRRPWPALGCSAIGKKNVLLLVTLVAESPINMSYLLFYVVSCVSLFVCLFTYFVLCLSFLEVESRHLCLVDQASEFLNREYSKAKIWNYNDFDDCHRALRCGWSSEKLHYEVGILNAALWCSVGIRNIRNLQCSKFRVSRRDWNGLLPQIGLRFWKQNTAITHCTKFKKKMSLAVITSDITLILNFMNMDELIQMFKNMIHKWIVW